MTKFEQQQQKFKNIHKMGESILSVLKTKTYKIDVKDNKEWEDYTLEFTIDNLYTSNGVMVAFDIKLTSMVRKMIHGNGFKDIDISRLKSNDKNVFNRICKEMTERFNREMSNHFMFKTVFHNTELLHLNNITV